MSDYRIITLRVPIQKRRVEESTARMSSAQAVFEANRDRAEFAEEVFSAVFVDAKNRVIAAEDLSAGSVDSSAVYPRQVARRLIELNACSVILMHNHPSGDPEPSLCDRSITRDLIMGARFLGFRVLDHVIIGRGKFFSFADHGLIQEDELSASMFPRRKL
jgi:DNA repair protein RadC